MAPDVAGDGNGLGLGLGLGLAVALALGIGESDVWVTVDAVAVAVVTAPCGELPAAPQPGASSAPADASAHSRTVVLGAIAIRQSRAYITS